MYNSAKEELAKTEVAKEGNGYVNKFFHKVELDIVPRNLEDLQVADPLAQKELYEEKAQEEKEEKEK